MRDRVGHRRADALSTRACVIAQMALGIIIGMRGREAARYPGVVASTNIIVKRLCVAIVGARGASISISTRARERCHQ